MVKKYIEGETKGQRKTRKALDKLAKLSQEQGYEPYSSNPLIKDKNYILCLKHGAKYSADYVNKLYSMVKRHCTLEFEMVCLTDDPTDIHPDIKILSLPDYLQGWWCKPYMFSNDLPLKGIILYMDLDVVIASNIDHLFTYKANHWCTLRDFTRKMRPQWKKYNSSVIRFTAGQLSSFWEDFKINQKTVQKKFHGDQDWLYEIATQKHKPAELFPDNWILSWKWEIRKTRDFASGSTRGNRKLRTIEHVTPPRQCCITVFHGDPNPHNCEDPWVVDNWK